MGISPGKAQSNKKQYYQTMRGKVIDHETKQGLIGANVVILKSNPFKGTASDLDGNFILTNVQIGRVVLTHKLFRL